MLLKEINYLIAKELRLEWKQKYAFSGLLLYVVSTVFVCYLSFKKIIDPPTWNALFWIILLFAAVNAIAKSFIQESKGQQLYFYSLVSPQAVILSKMIYNLLLLTVLSLINLLIYSLLIGNIVEDNPIFFLALILGSMGFSSVLTMVSAIASKANHNIAMMSVLSFPLIIPLLITTIQFSKNAIDGLERSLDFKYIIILVSINLLVVALASILFPYLWRE